MELTVRFGKNPQGESFIRSIKITPVEKYNPNDPNTIINSNLG
jgi:hypothetical protein